MRQRFREIAAVVVDDGITFDGANVRAVIATRELDGYECVARPLRRAAPARSEAGPEAGRAAGGAGDRDAVEGRVARLDAARGERSRSEFLRDAARRLVEAVEQKRAG